MSTPDYKAILRALFDAMPVPDSLIAPHADAWMDAKRALRGPHGAPPPPSRWQCPEINGVDACEPTDSTSTGAGQ